MLKKTILTIIFLFLNILTYGQKTPILQHISSYIITESDTIKIQRYDSAEYNKLGTIDPNYSYTYKDSILKIEAYLDARSRGEIPDNPDEIEMRFMNLTKLAKTHKVYFDFENYKKELLYYKTKEEKEKARIKKETEHNEEVKRMENKRIADLFFAKIKTDSLYFIERDQKAKQKAINDSVEYENQKKINEAIEKEKRKKENRKQIATKKQKIEIQKINKLETEKKQKQETKINLTIQVSGNSKR